MFLRDASTRGFTLIELLVYMAIMGFIIIVAGRAFSDSTGMRVRSQNMLASAEEAGRVSALLKEDVSQMGAKSFGKSSASGTVIDTVASVYMNYTVPATAATDLSSYTLIRNNPVTPTNSYDSLAFRKAYYDATGICGAVLRVEWYVRADSVLMRKCTSITPKPAKCTGTFNAATECPDSPIEMARNVTEFRLLPSIPGTEGSPSSSSGNLPFNSSDVGLSFVGLPVSGSRVTLGGFTGNSSSGTARSDFYLADNSGCRQFEFKAGEEYAIEFNLPCDKSACATGTSNDEPYNPMTMFQPGKDHLSVGLRNTNMNGAPINGVPDFMFYPPQNTTAEKIRHFEFSVPNNVTACVGITAAFYSPEAYKGHLEIENFKVYRKMDNIYHFDRSSNSSYNPSASSKADVKAFELTLGVRKRNEIGRSVVVIPVPNNGLVPVPGGN